MFPHFARRFTFRGSRFFRRKSTLRRVVAITISVSLLPLAIGWTTTRAARGPNVEQRAGKPRPGRPEGTWPNLEEVEDEGVAGQEREAAPPIASTLRSPKVPLQPWNGRRVGDEIRRAHARKRVTPPPLLDDQFIQNFFTWAVARAPNGDEPTFWNDQLRVAYAQGQASLKLAAVELGKTLFESAEYATRERNDEQYVYDLYKTFLMREPDASGWEFWESQVPTNGRVNVRRAFEEATEFAAILASIVPNGSASANAASLVTARVERRNQPAGGMLARDASWSVSLLSLRGRNGLDLGLGLSYSSMVWTRSGPYIHFDEDNGFPSPGFRLGFPSVQRRVFNARTAKNTYLLITAAGQRVELRQVGASNIYEAADSSYLQLTDNTPSLLLRATDGTQLSFVEIDNEYRCTQVKDRNGNYLTINHNGLGQITSVTDTLARVINFNYDTNANLLSITQAWNGQPAHQLAGFGWSMRNVQPGFTSGRIVGTAVGALLPVITQVTLNDTSHFTFDYTNALQVSVIRNYFSTTERNATVFTYETPAGDVPRLLDSRVSARNWTGLNGVPSQVITTYSVAGDGACVLTTPDGTIYKEYYGTGWQKELPVLSEIWSGGVRQKWTTTAWTQDNTAVGYEVNPRVIETNIYDPSGNRRRTVIDYWQYAQYGLPYAVKEYAADGVTVIRETFTDYNLSQAYLDRRIIGLVSQVHLTNVSSYQGKITYTYDDPARLHATPAAATQHDGSYNTSFTARGNVTSVSRWDFTDINNAAKKLTSYTNYSVTGTSVSATDPSGHQSSVSYADSFSDSVNRNTFAYPTTVTDADGFSSYVQYNYDFGATTRTQSPAPAGQSQGAIRTLNYNNLGQLERITTTNNGAYKRFWYGVDYVGSYATVNNVADELYSVEVVDGLGRVIGAAGNHPGSSGGYRLVNRIYDQMGRLWKQSNPTEVNSSWSPSGDDAAGLLYTQQTYDWKGRPLTTTNPDLTTKTASYAGCGCAGGEVVTLTDEGTLDGGVVKRRQQKIYSDVLGRTSKTEVLNWDGAGPNGTGGSVYSATVNTYNARDQLVLVRQYAGAAGSSTYQDTTMTYDGHGRLKTRHLPEQQVDPNTPGSTDHTTWDYNADDTIQKITDARGASRTFSYNNRHLTTSITYQAPAGITIPATVSNAYDAAGNRISMTDGSGTCAYNYDQLSRMTSETHTFNGLTGNFTLSYDYRLNGALKSVTDHTNQTVNYGYDNAGRVNTITGTNYVVSQFISGISYRAWGAPRQISYGNGRAASWSYNQRLQAAHFEIPSAIFAAVFSLDYQYYSDGRIKYSQDLLNGKYDRSYEYDHAGRIKRALSGAEARGEPTTQDRPYKETFSYDAFNHITTRTTSNWSKVPGFFSNDSYVNNRRTGWLYDADGNLTSNVRQYTYDAAGRMTFISGGNTNQFFDGNDQRVKLTEPNVVTYYLRSAVLGQVIAELDAAGTKTRGNIYLGAKLLARQAQNGSIVFEHDDPSRTKLRYTHAQLGNQTAGAAELDPLGADVYLSDPYLEDPGFEGRGEGFGEFGDVSDPSSGCAVDGLYSPCDIALRLLQQGAAVEAPAKLTRYHRERKRFEFFRAYADGYAGFLPTDARYYGNGFAFSASAANGSLDELAGIIELDRAEPQNPTSEELLTTGKTEAENRLKNAPCAKFFGGADKGLKALSSLNFSVDPSMPVSGRPQAEIQGNNVKVNPHRGSSGGGGLVTPDGVGHTFILVERSKNTTSIQTVTLFGADARAFGQLHETAHKAKRFGSTDNDLGPQRVMNNYENNFKIWKACFSSTPTQPWSGQPPLMQ